MADGNIKITTEQVVNEVSNVSNALSALNTGIEELTQSVMEVLNSNTSEFYDSMQQLIYYAGYIDALTLSQDISKFNESVNQSMQGFMQLDDNIIHREEVAS